MTPDSIRDRRAALDARFPEWTPRTTAQFLDVAAAEFADRPLILGDERNYTYREIAEIQGSTLPAVRSRIARARQAFRDAYETKESS